ncbi:hypothetical protein GLOIN_2v1790432 [Rhizophagus clarus]|uniref:Uncharacterized protein n=1 Tax=Rhizophagus clarus TaxID=94130 RepID=A0A8H3QK97_9GLOM|nr:hypothetical protein GLOIN_2v1790432 [Rhizophagus clarus]
MSYETNKDINDNNEGDNTKGEDDNDNDEIDKELSISCVKMGESLFTLLQHIHKLLTPSLIADMINNINKFYNSGIFLINDGGKSSQYLLSYILNDDITLEKNSAQIAGHSLSYFLINNEQEELLVSTSSYWTKELGESSKNSYNTGAIIYYYNLSSSCSFKSHSF